MISNNPHAIEAARSNRGVLKKLKIATGLQSSSPSADTGRGRSKSSRGVAYGFSLVKGKANHPMEDYQFSEFRRINNQEVGLFAIFDGHLSHEVPHFLQDNLFENIVGQVRLLGLLDDEKYASDMKTSKLLFAKGNRAPPLLQPDFWSNPRVAISRAYAATDKVILKKAPELGTGGSTAVTAILINGRRLLVANVGDSRAVLCRAGDALQLSVDHEPKEEKRMIERRGGFVTMLPGDVPRVDGQLAVARAFGDRNLKAHLSCDPDIFEVIVDATDEFLILASDGVWKVMENQEAVDLIRKVKHPETAAKMLADAAVSRKSKDDISCIVVRLR